MERLLLEWGKYGDIPGSKLVKKKRKKQEAGPLAGDLFVVK